MSLNANFIAEREKFWFCLMHEDSKLPNDSHSPPTWPRTPSDNFHFCCLVIISARKVRNGKEKPASERKIIFNSIDNQQKQKTNERWRLLASAAPTTNSILQEKHFSRKGRRYGNSARWRSGKRNLFADGTMRADSSGAVPVSNKTSYGELNALISNRSSVDSIFSELVKFKSGLIQNQEI